MKNQTSLLLDNEKRISEVDENIQRIFDVGKRLGKGAYGIVWKAIDRRTQETVALKKIFDAFRDDTDAQRTYREIVFLRAFRNHPNIIRMLDIYKASNNVDFYLIFEYMESDLHNVIKKGDILKDVHKRFVMFQLLNAIRYMHSGNVIHRDLKPSNILIDSKCRIKVADFGLARSIAIKRPKYEGDVETSEIENEPALTDYVATRWYRAPEILVASKTYTKGIDMWSLGCILGEMLRMKPLFQGTSTVNQIEKIVTALPEVTSRDINAIGTSFGSVLLSKKIPDKRNTLEEMLRASSSDAVDMVKALLVFDPHARLTAKEALHHEYVRRFRNSAIDLETDEVKPGLPDDMRMSVNEYRNKLYDMITESNVTKVCHEPYAIKRARQRVQYEHRNRLTNSCEDSNNSNDQKSPNEIIPTSDANQHKRRDQQTREHPNHNCGNLMSTSNSNDYEQSKKIVMESSHRKIRSVSVDAQNLRTAKQNFEKKKVNNSKSICVKSNHRYKKQQVDEQFLSNSCPGNVYASGSEISNDQTNRSMQNFPNAIHQRAESAKPTLLNCDLFFTPKTHVSSHGEQQTWDEQSRLAPSTNKKELAANNCAPALELNRESCAIQTKKYHEDTKKLLTSTSKTPKCDETRGREREVLQTLQPAKKAENQKKSPTRVNPLRLQLELKHSQRHIHSHGDNCVCNGSGSGSGSLLPTLSYAQLKQQQQEHWRFEQAKLTATSKQNQLLQYSKRQKVQRQLKPREPHKLNSGRNTLMAIATNMTTTKISNDEAHNHGGVTRHLQSRHDVRDQEQMQIMTSAARNCPKIDYYQSNTYVDDNECALLLQGGDQVVENRGVRDIGKDKDDYQKHINPSHQELALNKRQRLSKHQKELDIIRQLEQCQERENRRLRLQWIKDGSIELDKNMRQTSAKISSLKRLNLQNLEKCRRKSLMQHEQEKMYVTHKMWHHNLNVLEKAKEKHVDKNYKFSGSRRPKHAITDKTALHAAVKSVQSNNNELLYVANAYVDQSEISSTTPICYNSRISFLESEMEKCKRELVDYVEYNRFYLSEHNVRYHIEQLMQREKSTLTPDGVINQKLPIETQKLIPQETSKEIISPSCATNVSPDDSGIYSVGVFTDVDNSLDLGAGGDHRQAVCDTPRPQKKHVPFFKKLTEASSERYKRFCQQQEEFQQQQRQKTYDSYINNEIYPNYSNLRISNLNDYTSNKLKNIDDMRVNRIECNIHQRNCDEHSSRRHRYHNEHKESACASKTRGKQIVCNRDEANENQQQSISAQHQNKHNYCNNHYDERQNQKSMQIRQDRHNHRCQYQKRLQQQQQNNQVLNGIDESREQHLHTKQYHRPSYSRNLNQSSEN